MASNVIRHSTPEQRDVIADIPAYEDYKMAEELSNQPVTKTVDFDLKKEVDVSVARQITQGVKDVETQKRIQENMKTWKMQLSSIDSEEEKVQIAMTFGADILVEALTRTVAKVDNTYVMFCKKEDRKKVHSDALKQITEDMDSECKEIKPYLLEAEDFIINMIGREKLLQS